MKLYPFQDEGVSWLAGTNPDDLNPLYIANTKHRLLADDMGLGKTVQVIKAMDMVGATTAIILCPAAVKYHWARKIIEWSNHKRRVTVVVGSKFVIQPSSEIIILNYDLLLKPFIYNQIMKRGEKYGYDLCVADEAHYLKSVTAKRTKLTLGKSGFMKYVDRKWMLTGTPILNRPAELYPILRTLAPECIDPFVTWRDYAAYFCNAYMGVGGWDTKGASHQDELRERIRSFMLRRTKEEVIEQLPDKVEVTIEIPVDVVGTTHEYLATARRLVGMAKAPTMCEYIEEIIESGEKVVAFGHHKDVLSEIATRLSKHNPVILDGSQSAERKQRSIDNFITGQNIKLFLLQTHAGGVGVDGLQGVANQCVFLEPDWSPGVMDQAVDRLRRIGQSRTVFVHYMVAPNTLDDQINIGLVKKRTVIKNVISENDKRIKVMTDNSKLVAAFEAIAHAMTAIASTMAALAPFIDGNAVVGAPAPAAKPAKSKKTKEEVAAEEVATPMVAPTPPAPPVTIAQVSYTGDQLREKCAEFIQNAGAHTAEAKTHIQTVLFPQFGATNCDTIPEDKKQLFVDELAKGYTPKTTTASDL